MHDDDTLTPAERQALRQLPRQVQPGDLLEERTVQALASRGWIRPRRRIPAPLGWAAAAAACLLFFVVGFSLGRNRVERAAHEPFVDSPSTVDRPALSEASQPEKTPSEISLADTDTSHASSTSQNRTQYVIWF